VEAKGVTDITNMIGYNYRMTEIEAAIGIEQLKKLPALLDERLKNAAYLHQALGELKGLSSPLRLDAGSRHTYYVQPLKYDQQALGVHRNEFVKAIKMELPSARLRETSPLIGAGYVKPLYLQPVYQQKAGKCSFNCHHYKGSVAYPKGLCPVSEEMHFESLITHEFMRPGMSQRDLDDVVRGFEKVVQNIHELY
jgi:dTDP-4-amino-4,6-dideoxygalactose transaminase